MTSKNLRWSAAALAAAGMLLAGCGSDDDHDMGSMNSANTTAPAAGESGQASDHNNADIAFAQQMIPHHAQAIDMAKLAPGRTTNQTVLDLAARIEAAQDPEIRTLTAWLKDWGAEVPATDGGGHGGHGGHGSMPGMMTDDEMNDLEQAKDDEFDRMFAEMMIRHHQGAIEMAEKELAEGQNTEAKALAQKIIEDQRAEIGEMQTMLPQG